MKPEPFSTRDLHLSITLKLLGHYLTLKPIKKGVLFCFDDSSQDRNLEKDINDYRNNRIQINALSYKEAYENIKKEIQEHAI